MRSPQSALLPHRHKPIRKPWQRPTQLKENEKKTIHEDNLSKGLVTAPLKFWRLIRLKHPQGGHSKSDPYSGRNNDWIGQFLLLWPELMVVSRNSITSQSTLLYKDKLILLLIIIIIVKIIAELENISKKRYPQRAL